MRTSGLPNGMNVFPDSVESTGNRFRPPYSSSSSINTASPAWLQSLFHCGRSFRLLGTVWQKPDPSLPTAPPEGMKSGSMVDDPLQAVRMSAQAPRLVMSRKISVPSEKSQLLRAEACHSQVSSAIEALRLREAWTDLRRFRPAPSGVRLPRLGRHAPRAGRVPSAGDRPIASAPPGRTVRTGRSPCSTRSGPGQEA